MTVLLLMLGIIFQITQGTADVWKNSTGKTEGFRDARAAFEAMTRQISQATLNTYFDYADTAGNYRDSTNLTTFVPNRYTRRSDLHFISGKNLLGSSTVPNPITHAAFFQSPLGYATGATLENSEGLLNACGFYVQYSDDIFKPTYLNSSKTRNRFRLMQFTQPSQALSIYDSSVTGGIASWNNNLWFLTPLNATLGSLPANNSELSQLAENVVALVILPKYSKKDEETSGTQLSPQFEYNSRDRANAKTLHQLPPVVNVSMVIIDEGSAIKLGNTPTPPNLGLSSLFQSADQLPDDLNKLGENLRGMSGNAAGNTLPLRYEIFQTDVAIRGAKWSDN